MKTLRAKGTTLLETAAHILETANWQIMARRFRERSYMTSALKGEGCHGKADLVREVA